MKRDSSISFIKTLSKFDVAAIFGSGACAIHCLVLPSLAILSPSVANLFSGEWVHVGLLVLLIPIAIFTLFNGYKLHKSHLTLSTGIFGICAMVVAFLLEAYAFDGENLVVSINALGTLALMSAHLMNFNALKKVERPEQFVS